jgi:hypothetical protein
MPGLPGFNPINLVKEISSGNNIIFIEYYDFLADESNRTFFHRLFNDLLSRQYPDCGARFSAVYQRCL